MMRYHRRKLGRLAVLLFFLCGFLGEAWSEVKSVRGQTLYVPVYSEIPHGERATLELTVTLSIRNIDRKVAITVQKVDYHNVKGDLARAYAREPHVLPPFAASEFVIKASDRSGGISAGFLVAWESASLCVPPIVEAVMISTVSAQGISFLSQARVVEEKR